MSIFSLFSNKEVEKSNFKNLHQLLNIGRSPSDKELYLLDMFGETYRLSKRTRRNLMRGSVVNRKYPETTKDKLQLLSDMCMLMCIKNYFSQKEYDYCVKISNDMDINAKQVNEQIEIIILNSSHLLNGAYDGDSLQLSYNKVVI